jgi:hypothetical protein
MVNILKSFSLIDTPHAFSKSHHSMEVFQSHHSMEVFQSHHSMEVFQSHHSMGWVFKNYSMVPSTVFNAHAINSS